MSSSFSIVDKESGTELQRTGVGAARTPERTPPSPRRANAADLKEEARILYVRASRSEVVGFRRVEGVCGSYETVVDELVVGV